MLGLFAGLRTGELHRLRWRQFSRDAEMIEVVGKADKPATVATAPQLQEQLQRWRNVLRDPLRAQRRMRAFTLKL